MRRLAGQAARHGVRHGGRAARILAEIALALVVIAVAAGGVLAWRLSRGPMDVSVLSGVLERGIVAERPGLRVSIGGAALAWEGFQQGVDRPLDLRITGVTVSLVDGPVVLRVPQAAVSLSLGALLVGRVVPRAIEIESAALRLTRQADGSLVLFPDEEAPGPAEPRPGSEKPRVAPGVAIERVRQVLANAVPPQGFASRWAVLRQLRRVRITDCAVGIDDRVLGAMWRVRHVSLDLRRTPGQAATVTGAATMAVGGQTPELHVDGAWTTDTGGDLTATLSPVTPAAMASAAPGLAPLAALDLPVTLGLHANFGADRQPTRLRADVRLGAGTLHIARGTTPVIAGEARAEIDASLTRADLTSLTLETAPRPDGPRTVIRASGRLDRHAAGLAVAAKADVDQVAFADLAALWPAGTGGPGARPWITANITDGSARNAHMDVALTAPMDLSDATVTAIAVRVDGHDLTVHWLRPVPPIQHAEAVLTLTDPDVIDIAVASAVTPSALLGGGGGGGIMVRNGSVRLTGLAGSAQYADIDTGITASLPDAIALLRHPRIRLLDRRPIPLHDPAGQLNGRVGVVRLPLRDAVLMDDVKIHTTLHATGVHLGGIAAGHDLDNADLTIQADSDGLRVQGRADVARIRADLSVAMDFRSGPPTEVLQRVQASADVTAADMARLGLDASPYLTGPAGVAATWESRRDGQGTIAMQADLARAALSAPLISWKKAAGDPAHLDARIRLADDRIAGVEKLDVTGTGIDVRGTATFADGHLNGLRFDRVALAGALEASGELGIPAAAGDPWRVRMSGSLLDASGPFGHHSDKPAAADRDEAGPPWSADIRFDRVVLGPRREIAAAAVTGESDGRTIRRANVSGRAGDSPFRLNIAPQGAGRRLTGSAGDAGALLRALDVMDDMEGGALSLSGGYDDRRADHPLSGTARIEGFRIRNAPVLAKLLQAMTLYGLVDMVRGPGMGFTRLVANFTLARDSLGLSDARAFNSALGMTAQGRIDLAHRAAEITGTIVPAYFFNSLLGKIPLIGQIFSPEKGGGLFAATYSVRGPLADPSVAVNPLATLTPGFLRGLFDVFDRPGGAPAGR